MRLSSIVSACFLALLASSFPAGAAPFVVLRREVSQGLDAYPLVAGKSTLARLFIAPGSAEPVVVDTVYLSIEGPANSSIEATLPQHTFSSSSIDYSELANINFYIDGRNFPVAGPYSFVAFLFHDLALIGEVDLGTYDFRAARDLRLLVLFGRDAYREPHDLRKDTVLWPYILSAFDSLSRLFPIRDGVGALAVKPPCDAAEGLRYMVYPDIVPDSFNGAVQMDTLRRFNLEMRHGPLSCGGADRVVSFGRANANGGTDFVNGNEGGNADSAARVAVALALNDPTRGTGGAGMILAQEVAHTYGLVSVAAPNSDGGVHSKNFYIPDFSAFHITKRVSLAPSAITDPLDQDDFICRSPYTLPPTGIRLAGPTSVMNSINDQDCVLLETYDWQALLSQFAAHAVPERQTTVGDPVFYVVGRLLGGETLQMLDSRVLPRGSPVDSPAQGSPYTINVLDSEGRVLSSTPFRVEIPTTHDDRHDPSSDPHFNVAVAFPPAAARVELRRNGSAFASMTRSAHAPSVTLTAPTGQTIRPSAPNLSIAWQGSDPDGDPLTYTLAVSGDGGETFLPIGIPFGNGTTSYTWDTTFIDAPAVGVIRIEASDGFHTAQAQAPFTLSGEGDDCNGNGLDDATEIASGAPDLDASGVLDACEQGHAVRILSGTAAGGTATATVSGWSAVCSETVATSVGQSAESVAAALAAALAASACMTTQGITATSRESTLIVRGLQIDPGDLTVILADAGLQQSLQEIPTLSPILLALLAAAIAAAAAFRLIR